MIASITRGNLIDLTYEGHIAVCDAQGKLLYFQGDPQRMTFARSSTKPFQAACAILTGAVDHYGLDGQELALLCGSHAGTPAHLDVLRRIFKKSGLSEADLQCGAHPPFDAAARRALTGPPTPMHNNCSGKHAGMLLSAKFRGEDTASYTDLAHPHQQRIVELLAELCGAQISEFAFGIDGCGVPVHALPLRKFAAAFARLADPSSLRAPLRLALERVAGAMSAYPVMVSGPGRLCTRLMEQFPGRVLSKGGAGAFQALSLPEQGLGLVIKVESGEEQLLPGIVLQALRALGVIEESEILPFADMLGEKIRNFRGDIVGETRYHVELERAR